MKQSFLVRMKERWSRKSKKPWACFETPGPSADGRLEFSISWNEAFVNHIKGMGYTGGNDEELVQLFFLSTRVLPENLLQDEDINPAEMPRLSSEANHLRR